MSKINVAVLMGGRSSEREVSLSTGKMILSALDNTKYNALAVDTARLGLDDSHAQDDGMLPLSYMFHPASKPDVAFIALHGEFGEDGTIQGFLDLLGIPYVGSGVLASALALDKIMTRKVLQYEGITVPGGISVHHPVDVEDIVSVVGRKLGYPVVVKPNRQGSTIGLSVAHDPEDLSPVITTAFSYDENVLIEEFIQGIEITVPVLGNNKLEVLPVVEIVPASGFYDYHSKYTPGATDEIVPARLPADVYNDTQEIGLACHKALGCRGMSRTDMMVRGNDIYVLEVNTIPGMTPTSLLPRAAGAAGIEFPQLLDRLIGYALDGG